MRTAWNTPGKSMAATWLVVVISRISVRPWPRSKVTWSGAAPHSAGKHAASSRSSVGWLPGTPQHVLPAPVEQRFDVASVPGQRGRGDDGPGQVAVAVVGAVPGDLTGTVITAAALHGHRGNIE